MPPIAADRVTKTNPNGYHPVAVWVRFGFQLDSLEKSDPPSAENRVVLEILIYYLGAWKAGDDLTGEKKKMMLQMRSVFTKSVLKNKVSKLLTVEISMTSLKVIFPNFVKHQFSNNFSTASSILF